MQCQILGPLRVVDDAGHERVIGSAQQRRVVTLLAAHAPERVSVSTLEDVLWSGGAPSANALQALISKIRKVIAPATIVADGDGYVLHGMTTDVAVFERLVNDGRFGEAEQMLRGEPLTDLGDAAVVLARRARLNTIVEASRVKRLELAVESDAVAAMAELRSLVVNEPLVETWWRLLMLAEYRSGQTAGALETYQRARTTLIDEVGVEPGPQLRDLERRILEHDPALGSDMPMQAPIRGRRIPARLSSFVGRGSELGALETALSSNRLVTLVGPGGAGKTTTALELARRIAPDISRWAELAPLDDRDAIVRALATAVGLPESDQGVPGVIAPYSEPLDRVIDLLTATDGLIVLDNCEHVVATIAEVVHRLLVDCPRLRIVATSREALGVPGEHRYRLPPLPPTDAIGLFVERAADHGVVIDREGDGARISDLCVRLDGLPLAIELAAARLRTMTLSELLDGLADRFAVLTSGARTVDPRQQTLRSVIDWSHALLEPIDRVAFRRLSVFVGGCRAAAARAVLSGSSAEDVTIEPNVVDAVLERLVDKSLVVATPTESGMRFDLLETMNAYARERLVEAGELEVTLVRHAQYFADFVQPALKGLTGPDQPEWIRVLPIERQNIDAALATAVARDDAQLALEVAAPLGWYFFMAGDLDGGSAMLSDALTCSGDTEPELRAIGLGMYGWLAANGPNVESAVAITSEAAGMLDHVSDPWVRGIISNTHAMAQFFAGRIDAVERSLPEVKEAAESSGDPWVIAITQVVTGEILQFRGEALAAEQVFVEAARTFDQVGDQFASAIAMTEASEIAEQFGHYDRAAALLERGIEIAADVGFSSHPSAMRARLGNIEILRGNLDLAEQHHRSLTDDPIAAGVPWLQAMSRFGLSMIARRRGRLDEAEEHLDAAWQIPRTRAVPYLRALLLVGRGYLADQRGHGTEALEFQRQALGIAEQLDAPRGTAYALEGCAGAYALAVDDDAVRLGARLLGHADRLRRDGGASMPAAERFDLDRAEGRLRAALGDDFDTEFASGTAADTSTVIAAVNAAPSIA